jgi:hypothetical protein
MVVDEGCPDIPFARKANLLDRVLSTRGASSGPWIVLDGNLSDEPTPIMRQSPARDNEQGRTDQDSRTSYPDKSPSEPSRQQRQRFRDRIALCLVSPLEAGAILGRAHPQTGPENDSHPVH